MGHVHPLVTRLKSRRIELGLTADQVAKGAYISRSSLSKWENGHGNPRLHELELYAREVGMVLRLEVKR